MVASLLLSGLFVIRTWGRTPDGERLFTLFDDAMISMVYARNLSEGHGLVWSPGHETVEGYSNFAWTLVMAATHTAIPLPDRLASLPIIVIGIAVILGLIWGVWTLALTLRPGDTRAATIAAWLMALAFPVYFWTLRGMEVGVAALMLVGACILALRLDTQWTQRRAFALGFLLALAALTRDDLLVPGAVIGVFLVWGFRGNHPVRHLWPVAIPVVLAVIGHEIFRIVAYGELLPNTYYLKVGGLSLATRMGRGVSALFRQGMVGVWVLLALAVPALWKQRDVRMWLPVAVFASTVVYSVWAGGDAWERYLIPNRFLSCALPLLLVTAAFGVDRVASMSRSFSAAGRIAMVGVAAAAVFGLSVSFPWEQLWFHHGTPLTRPSQEWAVQGIFVNEHTPDDITIGVTTAGNLPYFARRDAVDFLGKNDTVIARSEPWRSVEPGHEKLDLSYSIGQLRPELILQMPSLTDEDRDMILGLGYVQASDFVWYLPGSVDHAFLDGYPLDSQDRPVGAQAVR